MRCCLLIVFAFALGGCCTAIRTSVYNGAGQTVQVTLVHDGKPLEAIKVRAASVGLLRGVMLFPGDTMPDSWLVSSGTNCFIFSDVSAIASMPRRFISSSRFTRDFPCNRVTQHVRIAPDMTIHAARVIGYTESEPPQFPIYHSTNH